MCWREPAKPWWWVLPCFALVLRTLAVGHTSLSGHDGVSVSPPTVVLLSSPSALPGALIEETPIW